MSLLRAVLKVGAKTSFEVSTTDTSSKAVSEAQTITIAVDVPVKAGEHKCAYVTQTQSTYDSTWTLPMSLTDEGKNGIRCQYSEPCGGHYYYNVPVSGMSADDTSYTMSGKSTAKVMSYGSVQTRDGACKSSSAVNGELI